MMLCSSLSHLWLLPIVLFSIAYCYIRNLRLFWAKRGVPFENPHWLFGNYRDIVTSKVSVAEHMLKHYNNFKNNGFGGFWSVFTPSLYLTDPEVIHNVMVKDFHAWSSRGVTVNEDADPLSANLVNLEGKKWKCVRKALTPLFTPGRVMQMFKLLLECAKSFEEHIDTLAANGGVLEAREISARFTTGVIGSCAFGIEINSLNDDKCLFRIMGKKIWEPSHKQTILRLIQMNCRPLFKLFKLAIQNQDVTEFFLKLTKDTFEYRDENNVQRQDVMDHLRNLRNTGRPLEKDEVEFDDNLLAAQAFIFFTAGFDTSSAAISFCLHELAHNQNIQDRLRDEVRRVKTENNGEITWHGLKNMKYLDMVVQEILRKYPPVPVLLRRSVKRHVVTGTGVELPAGSECTIPIYPLHHDPEYYPQPERFDPERFTEEAKSQRPPFTFIPFGAGPRICIGQRFAMKMIEVAVVSVVDRFKIDVCEKSENPLQLDPRQIFLVPKNGIWIRITKID